MVESDAELAQRTLQGDRVAFEKLINRYERSVRSVARAFFSDFHACEDATQETFVAAFRSLPTLRDRAKFGPWLMQIARRIANRVKEEHGRRPVSAGFKEPEAPPVAVIRPESQFLLSLVERLPDHERLVITIRYFDGHSCQEIADMTGTAIGSVTKQLSRAYERLRQWLVTSKEIYRD